MKVEELDKVVARSLELCYDIEKAGCDELLTEASIRASSVYALLEKYLEKQKRCPHCEY